MKTKLINAKPRTFAAVLDSGDEVVKSLTRLATTHSLSASQITAIGAFSEAVLGFFDLESKNYLKIPVSQQVEVLSFLGSVSISSGMPKLHAHVVLGKPDGAALGGHLLSAKVRPTLEVILTESPQELCRSYREEFGLPLIDLDA